jgi:signal transduction histidine kinase
VSRRPRLTVRARLTLLYTTLFAVCGAIVVAVSYALVAHLGTSDETQKPLAGRNPAALVKLCRAAKISGDEKAITKCNSLYRLQGAQHQRDLTLSHLLSYSLITLGVVIALAAILGWIVAGRALRPVHLVTAAARAASEHNLSARVALSGPRDELRDLADTFDEMLERLQRAFESQRRFIANASHELRTPLTVMRASVDVVLDDPKSTPADLESMGVDIRAAVAHAEQLIDALLILARNERGLAAHSDVDLSAVAEDVLEQTALAMHTVHPALESATVSGDAVLIERLVANLVDNAVRYNAPAGGVWISTGCVDGTATLVVENTGPLVDAADVDRIFEPFQRLSERTSYNGSGLGLAIVASIAAVHGGTAVATPRRGGGLRVTVRIPSAPAA